MIFRAKCLHMAQNEILEMIPPYMLEDINRRDPKPLFKVFVVGQEGKAELNWVGFGKVVKTWFADAIGKVSRLIFPGMRLFHNHPENVINPEDDDRPSIGEVAGSRTKDIDGKFSALIAAYIYPEYRNLTLNIASIEAELNLESGQIEGDVHDRNVDNISAIALGDERVNRPGFPGSTILAEYQAMTLKHSPNRIQLNKGGDMTSLSEVKDFIKTEKYDPSDVFGKDVLLADPIIVKALEGAGGNEHQARKRNLKEFEDEKEKWQESDKKKDATITELRSEGAKTKASDLFDSKLKERKLTERQVEFITVRKDDFKVSDPEKVAEETDTFLDKTLVQYKADAKIFGIEEETQETDELIPGSEEGEKGSPKSEDGLMPG